MAVKCVFYVQEVTELANGSGKVKLSAVAKGPYAEYSKWTPTGTMEFTSLNEQATQWFRDMLAKDVAIELRVPTEADLITPPSG